jgi:nucleotide-binding universal stress UspA family protein
MLKKTEKILFATNLSKTSRAAFNHIALLADQLNASIFLLHVIEKIPETYESRIKRLFGEEHWESVVKQRLQDARDILVGKMSSKMIIRAAMEEICHVADIQEGQCEDVSAEIIIEQGEIVDTILHQAGLHGCDLIAMGASKGFT